MKDLVIIGAGGFGREVQLTVRGINDKEPTWNFLGFYDDGAEGTPEGDRVLGSVDDLIARKDKPYFVIAIANSVVRQKIAARCREAGLPAATIINPVTSVAPNCKIGEGCILVGGSDISVNVELGEFCIMNATCVLSHDVVVGAYTSMMSSSVIGAGAHIGEHNYFGLKCAVKENVRTADFCTFGACAGVSSDVVEAGTYVGVPIKLIKPLKR